MPEDVLPEYAVRNRAHWTESNARYTASHARESWAGGVHWGVWHVPEEQVRALPEVEGLDVIELGCGTGYFGAWLKKRGARRVVGVDVTPAQLATAREMDSEFGLGLEFIEANAEKVPLPDASFDLAVSEYGASIWCDPYLWIPEAARLLRAGGELLFLRGSTLQSLCAPEQGQVAEQLVRPQKGMHRFDWPPEGEDLPSTEFHISGSEMFRLLRETGFDVVDFRELFAPDDAIDHPYYSFVPAAWARRWPAEEIWRARKR
ncbi:MAG TPA: class I SAM-dependent methyltransferase [Candidatus Dormibacteraeota bacterium]|nr:class I SAM-dependent methyltransferase [Candidatus Dormibacteraeota bacterium]